MLYVFYGYQAASYQFLVWISMQVFGMNIYAGNNQYFQSALY